jgi:hypothetical protein
MHLIFTQEQRDLFIREKEKIKGFSTAVDFMPVPINNGLYAFPISATSTDDFAKLKQHFELYYPDVIASMPIRLLTDDDKLIVD